MHGPDQEKHEHTGKHDVGEKMRAAGDAQHADAGAENERRAIGEQPQFRRRQRGRRQRPECAGRFAGDERTIVRTLAARIPPWREVVGAAELLDIDRARAAPMILEDDVGDNTGAERQRRHQKQRGAARDQHAPSRQDQFAEDGEKSRQHQERDDQARRVRGVLHPWLGIDGENLRRRIEAQSGDSRGRAADRRAKMRPTRQR